MLELMGTLGAFTVIATYFLSIKLDRPLVLAWGNVAVACMMIPVNVDLGLEFAVFLNGTFGLLGAYAIWKEWRWQRSLPTELEPWYKLTSGCGEMVIIGTTG